MTRPAFEMDFVARPEHIDELGHVNNAVWVQWIQDVALAHVVYQRALAKQLGQPMRAALPEQ